MFSLRRIVVVVFAFTLAFVPTRSRAGDAPITISASDQMKYDMTDIPAKAGQPLTIVLTNDGSMPKAAMAHNLVILKPGTDVNAFVADASRRTADGYLPGDDQANHMLVHTKMLGPGEEDTISFTPAAPGVYEYVCTFPGHTAAGMRGTITVR